MSVVETPELPETIDEYKKYTLRQQDDFVQQIQALTDKYNNLNVKYDEKVQDYLEISEKYRILQNALFGRSSEKWSVDEKLQATLFNEAELAVDEAGIE